jgi:hypothetical protein
MPQAIDLVLKNAAAVDKTFVLYNPSAGDNSLANWKLKEGSISSVFPWITALARVTANKSRTAQIKFRMPSSFTDTVTGLTQVGSACEVNISVSVPDEFPEALKADMVAFTGNLVNHALIKSIMRDAIPAT